MSMQLDPCTAEPDDEWLRAARTARMLSWVSLFWMTLEGLGGLWAGIEAGSIALVGWALSSAVEGLASVIIIWRFSGSRTLSSSSEKQALRAVAISFWLLAPYVMVEAAHKLITREPAETTILGIALTASSLVLMPALGIAKQRLGRRLGSSAAAGEGTQNLLCAWLAGAVLVGLALNALWSWWWVDPLIALGVAGVAIREGLAAWRGEGCGCVDLPSEASVCCDDVCNEAECTDHRDLSREHVDCLDLP